MSAAEQTRAIVPLGQTQRALALENDIVTGILAAMLPYGQIMKPGKGAKAERRTDAQRADLITRNILRHPKNPHVPFLATVDWSGKLERFGKRVFPVLKDGKPQTNADGSPKIELKDQVDLVVSGHTMIPNPNKPEERIAAKVFPLVVCDGAGGVLPYGEIKPQGQGLVFNGVDNMLSFFVQDIDPWTWKPRTDKEGNPVYKAVPCALARHNTVRHWNELVVRRADQDPDYPIDRELVVPMAHNLYGRPVLKLTPAGHPLLKGGYAVLRTEHRGRGGSRTRDALIIGRVAGKSVVAWDKGMQLILPPDGEGFQPHKLHIDEGWNNIRARVDGLWGAGTQTSIHEVGADASGVIDALSALGITLYDVGPRDVMGIVRKALHAPLDEKNPVLSYLIEHGHLQPDTDSAVQGRHIRGLGQMLTTEAGNAIHQARKDLVHSMGGGPAGRESGGMPTISDILSGDLTPEALLTAFRQQSGKCPLAQFIVKSSTAQRLGLEIMDWGCWVLTQARKDLLLELAKSQADGLQLPPRKKADPEVLAEPLTDTLEGAGEEASDPDDGVNGAAEEPAAAESASTEPPKGDDVEGDGVAQSV